MMNMSFTMRRDIHLHCVSALEKLIWINVDTGHSPAGHGAPPPNIIIQ